MFLSARQQTPKAVVPSMRSLQCPAACFLPRVVFYLSLPVVTRFNVQGEVEGRDHSPHLFVVVPRVQTQALMSQTRRHWLRDGDGLNRLTRLLVVIRTGTTHHQPHGYSSSTREHASLASLPPSIRGVESGFSHSAAPRPGLHPPPTTPTRFPPGHRTPIGPGTRIPRTLPPNHSR